MDSGADGRIYRSAIGLIETQGLVGVIEAADAAAKAADVQLLGFERIGGGLVTLCLCGDVASVQVAVQAGREAAQRVGRLISAHVIPAPHGDLAGLLADELGRPRPPAPPGTQKGASPAPGEWQNLPVARLRQVARQTPGVRLKGRQISQANKQELLAALEQARQPAG